MFWGHCGDNDWFSNYLNYTHHNATDSLCWLCPANRILNSRFSVLDVRPNAAFKRALHDPLDAFHLPDHPLAKITGSCLHHRRPDWMHDEDQGNLAYSLGSTLQDLLLAVYEGPHFFRCQMFIICFLFSVNLFFPSVEELCVPVPNAVFSSVNLLSLFSEFSCLFTEEFWVSSLKRFCLFS